MRHNTQTAAPASGPPAGARNVRAALRHYPTGVAVITATTPAHGPVAMVAGSFTCVSLDPPLIAFLPRRDLPAFSLLHTAGAFCVNVLAADQEPLCRRFAEGPADDFAGVNWRPAPSGAPVFDGAVAWLDCEYDSITDTGDSHLAIGRVVSGDVDRSAEPLLSFQGGYGRLRLPSLVAASEPDLLHGIRLAEHARDQIEALAAEYDAECSVLTPVGEDAAFVAIAARSAHPGNVALGSRVPLIPPLGSVFISAMGSVAVNAWLDRLPDGDDGMRDTYIRQLERVRERGYSLSLRGRHSEREMFGVVRDYSSLERLPEHERRFHAVIRETAALYEPEIDRNGRYDLHSIVVPVIGPMGLVQIALRLANLPRDATGAQVESWTARLRAAAAVVGERLTADLPALDVG